MKALAAVAALSIVFAGGALSSAHAHTIASGPPMTFHTYRFPLLVRGSLHPMMRSVLVAQQTTSSTATPTTATPTTATPTTATTSTPTPTPAPSPTATGTPTVTYPDGVTILQTALQVYAAITSAHVKLVTTAVKPDVQQLTITAIGDAFCKGPSLSLKVTGVTKLLGTAQKAKSIVMYAQKGKTTLKRPNRKNAVWKKVNANKVAVFGFPYAIGNPLVCPNSPQSSGGGNGGGGTPTDTFKDVVNQGPGHFKGDAVWHVHLTDVRDLGTSGTIEIPIDFLISQKHFTPYVITQTINDTIDGIVVSDSQTTTKIGEKYKFKLPKVGSR